MATQPISPEEYAMVMGLAPPQQPAAAVIPDVIHPPELTSQAQAEAGIPGQAPLPEVQLPVPEPQQVAPEPVQVLNNVTAPPDNLTFRRGRGNYEIDQNAVNAQAAHDMAPQQAATVEAVQAQNEETEALVAKNNLEAEQKSAVAQIDLDYQKQYEALVTDHQEAADLELESLQADMAAAAAHRIEPGRAWNTDAGRSLAGAFAAFTGGFLAPVLGKNDIQQIIDRGIDRDIEAQKYEGDQLQKAVANKSIINKQKINQRAREVADWDTQRLMRRAAVVGEFEAQLMKMNDPVMRARGEKIVAQQKVQLAKDFQARVDKVRAVGMQQVAQKNQMLNAARNRAHAAAMQKARFKRADAAARAKQLQISEEGIVRSSVTGKPIGKLPPGMTDGDREKFVNKINGSYEMADTVKMLMSMSAEANAFEGSLPDFLKTPAGMNYKSAHNQFIDAMVKMQSGATATDQERQRKAAQFPMKTFFRQNGDKVFETFLEKAGRNAAGELRARGIVDGADHVYSEIVLRPKATGGGKPLDDMITKIETNSDPAQIAIGMDSVARDLAANPSTVGKWQLIEKARRSTEAAIVANPSKSGQLKASLANLEYQYKKAKAKEQGRVSDPNWHQKVSKPGEFSPAPIIQPGYLDK